MIISENTDNINYTKTNPALTEFKFIKKDLPTAVQVYDDTVSMLTLTDDKNIGIIIEDKSIAETMKNIFDELWENSNSPLDTE